jgi:hypothetical protein
VSWTLDAGGIAGSAKNGPPWRFLVLGNRGLSTRFRRPCAHLPTCSTAPAGDRSCVSGKGRVAFDPRRADQNMMPAAGNEGVVSCPNGIASPDSLAGPFGTRGG